LLLDEIQDPHNLGAIIRTAAAAGADGIIITEKNSAKVNHTVIKTSSGATNQIRVSQISNIYKTIENLKREGYSLIGTDSKAGENLFNYTFPERCTVVFETKARA
jgi:23S rRNA (guanosine2251-2'-O)-methyltransferase